jgi:hypothetical protein
MNARRQAQVIELRRRVKIAIEALRALERGLATELGDDAVSPDSLADKIREASRAATRSKDH